MIGVWPGKGQGEDTTTDVQMKKGDYEYPVCDRQITGRVDREACEVICALRGLVCGVWRRVCLPLQLSIDRSCTEMRSVYARGASSGLPFRAFTLFSLVFVLFSWPNPTSTIMTVRVRLRLGSYSVPRPRLSFFTCPYLSQEVTPPRFFSFQCSII